MWTAYVFFYNLCAHANKQTNKAPFQHVRTTNVKSNYTLASKGPKQILEIYGGQHFGDLQSRASDFGSEPPDSGGLVHYGVLHSVSGESRATDFVSGEPDWGGLHSGSLRTLRV